MAEGKSNVVVETYIVVFNGHDEKGNPRCRADKLVQLKRTKTSEYPMEFLSQKDAHWMDGKYPIGSAVQVEKSAVII